MEERPMLQGVTAAALSSTRVDGGAVYVQGFRARTFRSSKARVARVRISFLTCDRGWGCEKGVQRKKHA